MRIRRGSESEYGSGPDPAFERERLSGPASCIGVRQTRGLGVARPEPRFAERTRLRKVGLARRPTSQRRSKEEAFVADARRLSVRD